MMAARGAAGAAQDEFKEPTPRDMVAWIALVGLLAGKYHTLNTVCDKQSVAEDAYAVADAMLAQRGKRS